MEIVDGSRDLLVILNRFDNPAIRVYMLNQYVKGLARPSKDAARATAHGI